MWKACSRCGKIHPANYKCNVGRVYRGGEERELRNKEVWHETSRDIRERTHYLCEVCKQNGIITYKDTEVHHIEKLKERTDLLLEDENLVCLCKEHHRMADRGEISKDYLRTLARRRDGVSPDMHDGA